MMNNFITGTLLNYKTMKESDVQRIANRIAEYDQTFKPAVIHPILHGGIIRILREELVLNQPKEVVANNEQKCDNCGNKSILIYDRITGLDLCKKCFKELNRKTKRVEPTIYDVSYTAEFHNRVINQPKEVDWMELEKDVIDWIDRGQPLGYSNLRNIIKQHLNK